MSTPTISRDTALGALSALGIDTFDESVYRALLRQPGATAEELARACEAKPAEVEAALFRLNALKFVNPAPEAPSRWLPEGPNVAVEMLLLKRQSELLAVRSGVPDLERELRGRRDGGTAGVVEIEDSNPAGQLRSYLQIHRQAQKDVRIIVRPPFLVSAPEQMSAARSQARDRGVHFRSIIDPQAITLPGWKDIVQGILEAGEEIRVLGDLPFKLVLADMDCALLPADQENPTGDAIIVRSSSLLHALDRMFETLWAIAVPVSLDAAGEPGIPSRADGLEPVLQPLLTMLAAGVNDKSIALQLGLSQRTLMRRMNQLYVALQAKSRFQAGWLAARIPPGSPNPAAEDPETPPLASSTNPEDPPLSPERPIK